MSIAIYSASWISHHWPFLNYSQNLLRPYEPSCCAVLQSSCRVSEMSALSWKVHISTWCASYLKQYWHQDSGKHWPWRYLSKATQTLSEHRAWYPRYLAVPNFHLDNSPTSVHPPQLLWLLSLSCFLSHCYSQPFHPTLLAHFCGFAWRLSFFLDLHCHCL